MSFKMVNYYEKIKNDDNELRHYPNEHLLKITLPFRGIICGPSGSGKTLIALNLIRGIAKFDKIVILAKNLEEPLYKYLAEFIHKVEKATHTRILLAIDSVKDLPAIDAFDVKENTLLIVDDFVADNAKSLEPISEMWIRGRKNGVSMAFISQSYFDTPKMIRKNSDYVFLKKVGNPKDLKRIAAEYAMGRTADEIKELYEHATSGEFTDFFLVDRLNMNPNLRFRKNFDAIEQ